MEIFMIILILIVMLLIIGINAVTIGTGVLLVMELFSILMFLFFALSILFFFYCKRKKAKYLRVERSEKNIHFAVYSYEGEEYRNLFPLDGMFAKKIYHEGRSYTVRLKRGKKHRFLFDWYSCLVMVLGLITSVTLIVGIGWFILTLREI